MTVRTRFAPSPTGFLHVGGARTALFCYLYARRHGGSFILRIEDTDLERSSEASVDAIIDGLEWLGLEHDEGPFFQSQRFKRYRAVAHELVEAGHAYHCYCTPERLAAVRAERKAKGLTGYDGHCRELTGRPVGAPDPVVRFRNPEADAVHFVDLVKGEISKENRQLNDFVMLRADGTPTYNFTVVVDDLDMDISHVIRGDDHLDNTASQINVYRALGENPPAFAHVPMILGHDGERLSKRHGAVSVMQYRENGYLPDALVNYLARLGWSHGDQEIFSRQELVALFDLAAVNRSPARFDHDKLHWLNHHYLQHGDTDQVARELRHHLRALAIDPTGGPSLEDTRRLLCERAPTVVELANQARFLYQDFDGYEEAAARKALRPAAQEPLAAVRERLAAQEDWSPQALQATLQSVVDDLGVGFGKVGQPLRVAITGRGAAPSNDQVLALLGRDKSLARIDRALEFVARRAAEAS